MTSRTTILLRMAARLRERHEESESRGLIRAWKEDDCRIRRKTTSASLHRTAFPPGFENRDPVRVVYNFFNGGEAQDKDIGRLDKWLVCRVASTYLDLSITVERFASDSDSRLTFYERDRRSIGKFFDDCLPKDPVYILPAGESFRIRICIGRDIQLRFALQEIVSVGVILPDGEEQPVKIWQRNREYTLDALIFVEPSKLDSKRLNKRCPIFGHVDSKYVKLTVHVKLRLGNSFPFDMDLYPFVYLQLKRPFRMLNFLKKLRNWKESAVNTLASKKAQE